VSYHDLAAEFRPLEAWPGPPTRSRKRAPFRASWSSTLALLKKELRALGARNVRIELDMPARMIRLDGYPRADARASGPGIILNFDSRYGPLRYPCDTFDSWDDNLRAVALSLEKLRAVDRYGVTKRGEQYSGFGKLPPAGGTSTTLTVEEAAAQLAAMDGGTSTGPAIRTDREHYTSIVRRMVKRTHPDAGGSPRDWHALQEVKRVLDAHHGGGLR